MPNHAAKALATVDHISHGRAGLNIVCGWNPDEFDMFGVTLVPDAYVQAKEWLDVIVETYNSFDQAKYVADQAGAQCIVLPDHVNGVPEADTYQKLFRYDVDKIIDAAKAGGITPATQEAR